MAQSQNPRQTRWTLRYQVSEETGESVADILDGDGLLIATAFSAAQASAICAAHNHYEEFEASIACARAAQLADRAEVERVTGIYIADDGTITKE